MNCCSKYFPRKAAKPATTAISMQAARMMQVKTGLESKCFVTLGITRREKKGKGVIIQALLEVLKVPCYSPEDKLMVLGLNFHSTRRNWLKSVNTR